MIITSKITMDLQNPGISPRICAVQTDRYSRDLQITLYAGNVPFPVPDNTAVMIRYRKSDGKGGEYDTLPDGRSAWSIHGNVLTVALAPQVLTFPGSVDLSVSLICGGRQLSLLPIDLQVEPLAFAPIAKSENYFYVTGLLNAPPSAKAGQFLRVSSVDTSGKVTAVEAIDLVDNDTSSEEITDSTIARSALYGKKIVYDGDSICESRTGSTANNGGGYAKIIADMVGGTYENKAVSGAALTSTPTDKTYHSVVDSLSDLPTDGDLYCFEGGYNDFCRDVEIGTCDDADYTGDVDTNTICGAMERIFRYCLSILIGRPVCFVIVHKCQSAGHAANGTGKTFKDYRDAMIQVCEKYSIPYYDAFTKSGLNGWNKAQSNTYLTANINGTGDGTHPNEQGYKRYYVPQLIALFESMMPTDVVQSEPGEESEPIVNLIDSVGYEDGYRLSTSAGTTKALAGYTTSGYIHATTSGDVYRTQGVNFNADENAQCIFVAYSADKTFETGIYLKNSTSPNATTGFSIETDSNGNLTITVTQSTERYFRISGYGYGANLILTHNQKISE